MSSRRLLTIALLCPLLLGLAVPAEAGPRRLGAVMSPVELVPLGDEPLRVAGLNSYLGEVELDAAGDGLVVSNRLSLERYVLGLNEVPLGWPMEALRAQAVAARTYALWTLDNGRAGDAAVYGFDICASVECQVYSGADVLEAENGERWAEAVETTRGEAVLYKDEPILARYHSVSGGRTFDNSDAFPDERDYPYLRSVPSKTEEASPLYRWRVGFELADLQAMLERWGWWGPGQGRLTDVHTIPSRSDSPYPEVVLEGTRGRLVKPADDLREAVGAVAPSMFPLRYPSPEATSSGRLPETLPSERFEAETSGGEVRILGRGWGHGTGMSQWGAHGMAQEGADHEQILTHYYSGVDVDTVDTPRSIEVGVGWGLSTVQVSGAFRLVDGRGRVVVRRALGTWSFGWAGSGVVAVDPPTGFFLPLEVGIVRAPERVDVGEPVPLTIALSRPAHVDTSSGGQGPELREAGRSKVVWRAPLQPGRYEVRVRASTGSVERASDPVRVTVEDQPGGASPAPAPEGVGTGAWAIVAVVLIIAIALGAIVFVGTIFR